MPDKQTTSERDTKLNLYQRLLAIMADVGYVQKEDKRVNNQYRFVSHDAVVAALRPSFIRWGVVPEITVLEDSQDGNRTKAVLGVTFVNVDKPEDRLTVRGFGYGIDPQDKGPGKAVSYALKYVLLKTLMLETGDDPERDMIDHEPGPSAGSQPDATPDYAPISEKRLRNVVEALGKFRTPEELEEAFNKLHPADQADKRLREEFGKRRAALAQDDAA